MFHLRLDSLSVASYDSRGYGGIILTRLHAGLSTVNRLRALAILVANPVENVSSGSSIEEWCLLLFCHVFVAAEMRISAVS
jgi:hypothetical protein